MLFAHGADLVKWLRARQVHVLWRLLCFHWLPLAVLYLYSPKCEVAAVFGANCKITEQIVQTTDNVEENHLYPPTLPDGQDNSDESIPQDPIYESLIVILVTIWLFARVVAYIASALFYVLAGTTLAFDQCVIAAAAVQQYRHARAPYATALSVAKEIALGGVLQALLCLIVVPLFYALLVESRHRERSHDIDDDFAWLRASDDALWCYAATQAGAALYFVATHTEKREAEVVVHALLHFGEQGQKCGDSILATPHTAPHVYVCAQCITDSAKRAGI